MHDPPRSDRERETKPGTESRFRRGFHIPVRAAVRDRLRRLTRILYPVPVVVEKKVAGLDGVEYIRVTGVGERDAVRLEIIIPEADVDDQVLELDFVLDVRREFDGSVVILVVVRRVDVGDVCRDERTGVREVDIRLREDGLERIAVIEYLMVRTALPP
jgi:hypothetical protein